jgi:predicted SAM-dependent methyltransferase
VEWGFNIRSLRPPINYNTREGVIIGQEVADARNAFCEQAIDMKCKFIYFQGDDVLVPGHTLQSLIYRMEHDEQLGVVGGVYVTKSDVPQPLVFRGNGAGPYWDWKVGEYFQVTGIGMDATIIRTDVLKQMEKPWFKTIREDGFLDAKNEMESWTEDLWFCNRVYEETDYHVYADSMVMCTHFEYMGNNAWRPFTLRADSRPMQREEIDSKRVQAIDLGCGPEAHWWNFGPGYNVDRVDIRDECNPDYRCDLRRLPFNEDEYDVVFSSHTLEHFARDEVDEVLTEWTRIMKPTGEMTLIVPDLTWAAQQIINAKGRVSQDSYNVLYGSQEYRENFHKVGFTLAILKKHLTRHGLTVTHHANNEYNLLVTAKFAEEVAKKKKGVKRGVRERSGKQTKGNKK